MNVKSQSVALRVVIIDDSIRFLGAARNTPEFAVFVFSGLTMWALFNETVSNWQAGSTPTGTPARPRPALAANTRSA